MKPWCHIPKFNLLPKTHLITSKITQSNLNFQTGAFDGRIIWWKANLHFEGDITTSTSLALDTPEYWKLSTTKNINQTNSNSDLYNVIFTIWSKIIFCKQFMVIDTSSLASAAFLSYLTWFQNLLDWRFRLESTVERGTFPKRNYYF